MPEWSNGTDSKSVVPARVPRVRIPVCPPYIFIKILILNVLYNCKSSHIHFDIQFVNANDEIQF